MAQPRSKRCRGGFLYPNIDVRLLYRLGISWRICLYITALTYFVGYFLHTMVTLSLNSTLMKTKHHFRINFYVKKTEPLRKGELSIMCRISTEGERCAFSTHLSVKPQKWNVVAQRVLGRSEEAKRTNGLLDDIRYALHEAYIKVLSGGEGCSPQTIRDKYLGLNSDGVGVVEFFRQHNQEFAKMVGLTRSESSLNKYKYVCQHLEAFIRQRLKADDVAIAKVNQDFIREFHRWLVLRGCGINTVRVYLGAFKRIVQRAIGQGVMPANPFVGYRLHSEYRRKNFLMKEELRRLINYTAKTATQQLVLDAFLFSCFTGLSFADVKRLTLQHIVTKGGYTYIYMCRKKTHHAVEVPLLHLPKTLLLRYLDHRTAERGAMPLFALPSNYHSNNLLRAIMCEAGITRPVTFHSARHTFATTVTLANGVPLEVVSAMLGHSDIKTTQIYAQVLQSSVQSAVKHLSKEINSYYFSTTNHSLCSLRP